MSCFQYSAAYNILKTNSNSSPLTFFPCSKPLWSTITDLISIPLPVPGQSQVLFAVENCLLSAHAPPRDGLPYAELSFQPLVQCLDIEKFTRVFTAVLLEKRVLLRASK